MIKVLFIHYTSDIVGGSDKSLFELVSSLDKESIEPIMLLKKNDPMIGHYKEIGLLVYEIGFYGPPKKLISKRAFLFLLTFLPSVLAVLNILKKEKPNVIHVNTSLNIQGGIAAYLSKIPFIWHIREIMGSGTLDSLVKKVVCKLATKTVVISNAVKENYNCKNTTVVYNGMDLTKYQNLKKSYNNENIIISCIGRFEEWKGQHILVEAISNLISHHKNIKVQFVGGPASAKPEYLENLKTRVSQLNLNNYIDFLGIRNDVPDILANTDILVVPTSTSEPFGRTVIEGMAASCIVIATAAGGPLEIIKDKQTGFLVTPNSVDALSNKLVYVINEFNNLKDIGIKAKEVAKSEYDIKRVASEMENIFKEIAQ